MNLPTRLHLEVTNRCNSPCQTCIRTHAPDPDRDLSVSEIEAITAGLPDLHSVALQVNGEPLLHPRLAEIVQGLVARGVRVELNTNGLLLGSERAALLLESGLDALNVSLESMEPRVYEALRGVDAQERVVEGIKKFLERRGATPAKPRVSLWMTVTRRNLVDLPRMVELAARLGAEEVYMQRLVYFEELQARSENSLHGQLTSEHRQIISQAQERADAAGVELRACGHHTPEAMLEMPAVHDEWRSCRRPFEGAVVMANGDVVPCCISTFLAPRADIVFGNILREPWGEIWNGPGYQDQRRRMKEGDPPPHCVQCGSCWSL